MLPRGVKFKKKKKMTRGASLKTFVITTTRNIHYYNLCVWPLV